MLGVSEVIAIILILMITISLAGLAYMFMSTTMSDVTSSAGSTVDATTSSMLTSFTIESLDVAKVYVRNTGQNAITSLSVYVNDVPAHINMTPTSISPEAVGTITIYDFIAEGDTIKITSPSGFSTSKRAPDPCSKAVGCWKFDETSGTSAYDSSSYGNDGTLTNGPLRTSGKVGNGLDFDGTNDYVNIPYDSTLDGFTELTISMWIFPNYTFGGGIYRHIFDKHWSGGEGDLGAILFYTSAASSALVFNIDEGYPTNPYASYILPSNRTWYYVVGTYNKSATGGLKLYVDGILRGSANTRDVTLSKASSIQFAQSTFRGIIDEVRVYNRVIY